MSYERTFSGLLEQILRRPQCCFLTDLSTNGNVQARCHGVQSATWTFTKLPRATCTRRRCVWSSSTPLCRHESHPGAARHVHHSRQSSLPGCCPTNLEFSTRRRYRRWVAANLPEKAEKTSILSIVSWLLLLTLTPAVDLAVAVPLRPLWNTLIDWLIDWNVLCVPGTSRSCSSWWATETCAVGCGTRRRWDSLPGRCEAGHGSAG